MFEIIYVLTLYHFSKTYINYHLNVVTKAPRTRQFIFVQEIFHNNSQIIH